MKTILHAEEIFRAGLERVNSRSLIETTLSVRDNTLFVKTDSEEWSLDLSNYKKIKLIGFGKASAQMARGLCNVLGDRVIEGLIIVKDPTDVQFPRGFEVLKGSHPIPDEQSEIAGKKMLDFCLSCGEGELVLGVISGGASALMEIPVDELDLVDLQNTTQRLMECGATIYEINCIRKHLSKIKGGKLARALYPALSVNFILSDVVGDDLSVIGSGPTVGSLSTVADTLAIIEKYELVSTLPLNIVKFLESKSESTETRIINAKNILIGSNRQALKAARNKAEQLGYDTIILSDKIQGEASEVAKKFYAFSKEVEKGTMMKRPACVLAGGETTVTIQGNGKGGRNQEMALAYLNLLDEGSTQVFLSASTDGSDGPTDATGAFATSEILDKALALAVEPMDYLFRNDSYHFFEKVGGHLKTGPTETNVCDLQILIIV